MTRAKRSRSTLARAGALLAVAVALSPVARADEVAPAARTPVGSAPGEATHGAHQTAAEAQALDPILGVKLGLSGPRQFAHVLIRRQERAEGKNELSLFETSQVNGKFTWHEGTGLEWAYHLREAFAFGLGGTYYWYAVETPFTEDELIKKAKQQPFAASALLLEWEGHAGVELSPIYGKFAVFNSGVVQFGFYFGTAFGVAGTRVQLRSANPATGEDRTFGDTGMRPVALFNGGFRMFFSQHVALKAEVRDTVFASDIETINGCSAKDLQAITDGQSVSRACNSGAFVSKTADVPIATELIKDPSSDVLNNIAFNAALSVLF